MVQAVRNTAHGHVLSHARHGEQTVRLAADDVFLAALAPLWLVFPSPAMLLVVEQLRSRRRAHTYWLARKHIGWSCAAVLMA